MSLPMDSADDQLHIFSKHRSHDFNLTSTPAEAPTHPGFSAPYPSASLIVPATFSPAPTSLDNEKLEKPLKPSELTGQGHGEQTHVEDIQVQTVRLDKAADECDCKSQRPRTSCTELSGDGIKAQLGDGVKAAKTAVKAAKSKDEPLLIVFN